METDEVMKELRAAKKELAEECGHDLDEMFRRFREFAAQHPERMSDRQPVIATPPGDGPLKKTG